jgi:hypothetical protein
MWFIWSFNIFVPITSAGLSPKSLKKKFHTKEKSTKEKVISQLSDILQSLSMAYVKTKNKTFKNLMLFLPDIPNDDDIDMEKVLGDILGADCITSTNLYKKL